MRTSSKWLRSSQLYSLEKLWRSQLIYSDAWHYNYHHHHHDQSYPHWSHASRARSCASHHARLDHSSILLDLWRVKSSWSSCCCCSWSRGSCFVEYYGVDSLCSDWKSDASWLCMHLCYYGPIHTNQCWFDGVDYCGAFRFDSMSFPKIALLIRRCHIRLIN